MLRAIRGLRSRLHRLGVVDSRERLRSDMIQGESNEAFRATLRSPDRAAAIRQRAH